MRLVTTCPQCSAAFYVGPEQLAAHRGDVRCGKCEYVFNALDRLAEVEDEEIVETVASSPSVTEESVTEAFDAEALPEPETEPQSPVAIDDIEIISAHDEPFEVPATESQLVTFNEGEAPENEYQSPEKTSSALAQPVFNITDFRVPPSATVLSPTMMEDAARNKTGTSKKRGFLKFLISLVVFLLIFLALGQAIYFLRSDIVARWPQTRPYLEMACGLLQCDIGLPKKADLIAIDDSDLKEDAERQGLIHLYTTLVNKADHSQEFPLLELTLTDANDGPLLRRTFKPGEYLQTGADVRRGISAQGRVDIKLSLSVGDDAVAGYRLFVTY
jgi:predicted Zn finger-like uncharacterized protein